MAKELTVVIPSYNMERYLPKCLASLIGQTLQDIEVICINDGSPDRCIDILHEWQERYPARIVIIDKENEGVWRGRMDGIAIARGEYIGFLDSDDYAEPDFAEELYNAAKAANADIAVCADAVGVFAGGTDVAAVDVSIRFGKDGVIFSIDNETAWAARLTVDIECAVVAVKCVGLTRGRDG